MNATSVGSSPVRADAIPDAQPALEMRGIRKSFFGVEVLKGIDLDCTTGEIHALVGENGAGKSTLMKILAGVHGPDAGTVALDGNEVRFRHPRQAQERGVSLIYQELTLLPERTVEQNIFLGREPVRRGRVDVVRLGEATKALLERLNVAGSITPRTPVRALSVAQQQMVEIAKALSFDARILVMDEPTAALSPREVESLFAVVRQLRDEGLAVVYISHRLDEVFSLADRITVLKDGAKVGTVVPADVSAADLVELMVGRRLDTLYPPLREEPPGPVRLRVKDGANRRLHAIDLELRAGEIVGIAGLEGAGRSELARALFGADPFRTGVVEIDGRRVAITKPRKAIEAGLGFLSEDRKGEGLLARESVLENSRLVLRALPRRHRRARTVASTPSALMSILGDLDLRTADVGVSVQHLSGGNQQKVVLAKWLATRAQVLLFDEPTRGVDVGAKAAIHQLMRRLAVHGAAILMISSELPEVIGMSDRILVMRGGHLAGELPSGASEADIMLLATGAQG